MDLFTKLEMHIDYNNNYSIKKALSTLEREYNLAVRSKNKQQAMEVINASRKLYDKIILFEHHRWPFIQKILSFIAYLTKRLKSDFGVCNIKDQILDIVE